MSNQDLINYQLSLEANNTAQINALAQANVQLNNNISQLNQTIIQLQAQIEDNNIKSAALSAGNVMIEETIAFIPPDTK